MVLDTVHRVTDNLTPGYVVGDFKLVFKNTYDDEENGQPKQVTLNANDMKAPDFFYYVHIEVWACTVNVDSNLNKTLRINFVKHETINLTVFYKLLLSFIYYF